MTKPLVKPAFLQTIKDWPIRILEREIRALQKSIDHWVEVCGSSRFGVLDSGLDISGRNCPLCGINLELNNYGLQQANCKKCSLCLVMGAGCPDPSSTWRQAFYELGGVRQEEWTKDPGPACREMLRALESTLAVVEAVLHQRQKGAEDG